MKDYIKAILYNGHNKKDVESFVGRTLSVVGTNGNLLIPSTEATMILRPHCYIFRKDCRLRIMTQQEYEKLYPYD